jgi:glycosyltransferase involved in cell wall biosynthesis
VLWSIITPSFRSSQWLKLCIASVADQGVPVEHLVQDAGSDDGTLEWLMRDARVKAYVEKDQGMYDALNRGFRRCQGELLAWLNCDEQYLPGALRLASEFFERHPEVDMVFGDVVMVNPEGQYLSHRKMQTPLKYHTWTAHLSTLSCATFFRRRVMFECETWFDTRWRDAGDGEWMVRLLKRGIRMAALGQFTSTFTQTGANMSAAPNARRENLELRQSAPAWVRALRPAWIAHHRLRRLLGGIYFQRPFAYEIYTVKSPGTRQHHAVEHPVFHRG